MQRAGSPVVIIAGAGKNFAPASISPCSAVWRKVVAAMPDRRAAAEALRRLISTR